MQQTRGYVHYTTPTSAPTRTSTSSTSTPVQQQPTTVAPKDVTFKTIIHSPTPRPPVASTSSTPAAASTTASTTAANTTVTTTRHHAQATSISPAATMRTPVTTTATTTVQPPASISTVTTSTVPPSTSAQTATTPSAPPGSVLAQGDWTKDLVQLARTAELKKHALALQLHTAHILSSHALLEQKNKAIQDVKEQRNKLESERTRLLESLRQVNEDRDKADILTSSIEKECAELRSKISQLSEGDYAAAKRHVDQLRKDLGQSPLPSLQTMLDEKSAQYLNERRLNAAEVNVNNKRPHPASPAPHNPPPPVPGPSLTIVGTDGQPVKRPRGRPKGSKNRKTSG
ncbi:hypothetical protein AAF712_012579 [Marasmius tenuissimus]|uniref:Uncharacterized protein n=1 Tax=Marasmius tenuissimus TaxID=585030 RepID=A0ABR2ZG36_9AGAR|nr:hypothetical protein PM082_023768 [Marasmius tenuissimus]